MLYLHKHNVILWRADSKHYQLPSPQFLVHAKPSQLIDRINLYQTSGCEKRAIEIVSQPRPDCYWQWHLNVSIELFACLLVRLSVCLNVQMDVFLLPLRLLQMSPRELLANKLWLHGEGRLFAHSFVVIHNRNTKNAFVRKF